MNPITETRYTLVRYIALWSLFTAAYTVAFGVLSELPAWVAAVGGAVYGVVSGFEGLILWNILKYGTVGSPRANFFRIGTLTMVTVTGLLFVAVAVGAQTAAIYLTAERLPTSFTTTIPARGLVTAAVYVCFVLWYSSAIRSENARPREETPTPAVEKATSDSSPALERITVRGTGGRIEVIETGRIAYIQAEGDYVAIVTPEGRWLKEGTMKYFEEALPRDRFVRVHRSYIVAVGHISRIETTGRDHTLVLHSRGGNSPGGGTIRMSEAGYRLLKRTLGL
jgi:DNA-binding LytR/AlgR family response regulator